MFIIGILLVNSFLSLVLFHWGVSRSFVSQSFIDHFAMAMGDLECSYRVSITNEHKTSTSCVFHDCRGFMRSLVLGYN